MLVFHWEDLRDEAEIVDIENIYWCFTRNYSKLKKAGTSNPVFVLDEIDKLSSSNQGDPPSALLRF
jgi:ATP-dependent Lon protease